MICRQLIARSLPPPAAVQWQQVCTDYVAETTAPYWRFVHLQTIFFLARTGWASPDTVVQLVTAAGTVFARGEETIFNAGQAAASLWDGLLGYLPVVVAIPAPQYAALVDGVGAAMARTVQRVGLVGGDAVTSKLRTAAYNMAVLGNVPSAVVALLALFAEAPAEVRFG